jgi:hypothetical protein
VWKQAAEREGSIFMKKGCLCEGDNTSLSAPRAAFPGFRAAFDLQFFNDSQALVRTVDGKVTLDFTQPVEPGAWHDIVDENGNVYGTIRVNMDEESTVYLASPPEGVSPIEAVVYSPTQAVQLGQFQ